MQMKLFESKKPAVPLEDIKPIPKSKTQEEIYEEIDAELNKENGTFFAVIDGVTTKTYCKCGTLSDGRDIVYGDNTIYLVYAYGAYGMILHNNWIAGEAGLFRKKRNPEPIDISGYSLVKKAKQIFKDNNPYSHW